MAEITLRQLQYFVAVIDEGSVTGAAQRCHISQSAASMALAQLEHGLTADLLLRTRSKRVVPTAAGVEFAAHARDILARIALAEEAVSESIGEMRGELRIGCSHTLSPRLIPPLVDHFTTNFPGVTVTFREGTPADIQHDVAHGRLDLALVYALQSAPDLEAIRVAAVHLHVMLSDHHRLAGRRSISLLEVADEDAILLDIPPTIDRLQGIFRSVGISPRIRWTSRNAETIQSMVSRGLGFSLINSVPADGTTFEGLGVVYLPVSDDIERNAIHVMLPPDHRSPRRVLAVVDFLRRHDEEPEMPTQRSGIKSAVQR